MLNISVESEDARLLMEVGYLYMAMRRSKEAEAVFEGVQALVPKSEVPVVAQGNVHCVQGRFDKAIKIYESALKLVPDSAFAKAYLGEAWLFKGDESKAQTLLQESSQLDPQGKTGDFARALLDLMKKGFRPGQEGEEKNKTKA